MRWIALLGLVSLCPVLAGCDSGGPKIVKVSGTVMHGGKPVPNIEVFFQPTTGRNSVATTDANGKFTLGYTADTKGAVVGTHKVFVTYNPPNYDAKPPTDLRPILAKYGSMESTPKVVEITKAVDNLVIDLD
jgi:hypothetical protein